MNNKQKPEIRDAHHVSRSHDGYDMQELIDTDCSSLSSMRAFEITAMCWECLLDEEKMKLKLKLKKKKLLKAAAASHDLLVSKVDVVRVSAKTCKLRSSEVTLTRQSRGAVTCSPLQKCPEQLVLLYGTLCTTEFSCLHAGTWMNSAWI